MATLGIGPVLKQERLRQNIGIEDISRQTRISSRFIEAIEDEDFSRLPAMVFTRGFVRQYSAVLNLDSEPLLLALPKPDLESAPLPDPPLRPGRRKWDPRVKSALQTVVFLAVATTAGKAAWTRYNHGPWFAFDSFRAVRAVNKVAVAVPAPLASARQVMRKPEVVAVTAPAPHPVEVIVAARASSWVRITADGRPAFVGMLQPSEVRTVAANENVKVLAGNAGGVEISLNGKKLDPIGPAGQVRSVVLTAEGLQQVVQTPPPSHEQF